MSGKELEGGYASDQLNRRAFIKWSTAGAFVSLFGLPGLLGACSAPMPSAPPSSAGASKAARVSMPTYIPAQGPKPDYPGTADGVDPGYLRWPGKHVQFCRRTTFEGRRRNGAHSDHVWPAPSAGTECRLLTTQQAARWLADDPGYSSGGLRFQVGRGDGGQRFARRDVRQQVPILPNIPAFAKATCADLSPYLSGDAVKEYPNLANYPSASWRIAIKNNAIYGVPIVRSLTGPVMFVQQGLVDAVDPAR